MAGNRNRTDGETMRLTDWAPKYLLELPLKRFNSFSLRLLLALCLFTLSAHAQVPVSLAPSVHPQFLDATGKVLAGGFVYTYSAGTTTRLDSFTDSTGSIANAWPIPLDATGSPSNGSTQTGIWLANASYKLCAYNAALVQQWCVDSVSAYQILNNIQNITFGNVTSDPTGAAGMLGYRSDIPCFRGYTLFWDCFVTFTGIQTLTNKTLTSPIIATPTITAPILNGTPTGTSIQGTDTKVLSSGTVSGTGVTLCTDANGGATTSGCSTFPGVVFNTVSASTNSSIAPTTMATAPISGATYRFTAYGDQTILGASCTTATTITVFISFQDPNEVSQGSTALYTLTPIGNNGSLGRMTLQATPVTPLAFGGLVRAKGSTTVSYFTTYTAGANCSPAPSYQMYTVLEQITAN